jgi:hypothetical protein
METSRYLVNTNLLLIFIIVNQQMKKFILILRKTIYVSFDSRLYVLYLIDREDRRSNSTFYESMEDNSDLDEEVIFLVFIFIVA